MALHSRAARIAVLLSVGLAMTATASGADMTGRPDPARASRQPPSVPILLYRAFVDHLAARRRGLSEVKSPPGEGRTMPVEVRPISFSQGLWIFGGSIAFSVVKVLGLSLLYYAAPGFVETWGPTFG